MTKKYQMYGVNKYSGSVFEIEFTNPEIFSRESLKDTVLLPKCKKPADMATKIIIENKGASDFFKHIGKEVNMSIAEIEQDITELERRLLINSKRNTK